MVIGRGVLLDALAIKGECHALNFVCASTDIGIIMFQQLSKEILKRLTSKVFKVTF